MRRELEGSRERPGRTETGCCSLSKAVFPQLCGSRSRIHAQVNMNPRISSVPIPLPSWPDTPQGITRRHPPQQHTHTHIHTHPNMSTPNHRLENIKSAVRITLGEAAIGEEGIGVMESEKKKTSSGYI